LQSEGEAENGRGKGAKANSATLECDIFRFGASGLQCEGNAQTVRAEAYTVRGEAESLGGGARRQKVQEWSVTFFVSGLQACSVSQFSLWRNFGRC
jgi:hypothetical protein